MESVTLREGYSRLVVYANAVEYIFYNRFSNTDFNTIKNSFPIVTWDTKLVEVHILLYKCVFRLKTQMWENMISFTYSSYNVYDSSQNSCLKGVSFT